MSILELKFEKVYLVTTSELNFGEVECSKCKVHSIQLFNPLEVDAVWKFKILPDKRLELDPHLPMHVKKQIRKDQKPLPRIFEVLPTEGVLQPG